MNLIRKNPQFPPLCARLALGGMFLVSGFVKVHDPVEFVKLLREYGFLDSALVQNAIAGWLPWVEVLVGIGLVFRFKVAHLSLLALGMLLPFTLAILARAWGIAQGDGTTLCSVRFDCGCGSGVLPICWKLMQNLALMTLAAILVRSPR